MVLTFSAIFKGGIFINILICHFFFIRYTIYNWAFTFMCGGGGGRDPILQTNFVTLSAPVINNEHSIMVTKILCVNALSQLMAICKYIDLR